jgi:ribosomal protein L2
MKLFKLINHKLVQGTKYFGGRNNYGRITIRHRGVLLNEIIILLIINVRY